MGKGVVGLGGGVKGGRVEGGRRAREIVGGFKLRWLFLSTTTNNHLTYSKELNNHLKIKK